MNEQTLKQRFTDHPKKNDILKAFNDSWGRRRPSIVKEAGLSNEELIPGQHYYICPITEIPHISYNKAYFKRFDGIFTKDEFENEYFKTKDFYQTPFNRDKFKNTWNIKNQEKQKAKPKYGNITVNGHVFDLDHYHEVYKKKIERHIKARRKNGIPDDEWIPNYAYFECPLTMLPILQMASVAHLNALSITEDQFKAIFPDISLDNKQPPRTRGFTLEQFVNNGHLIEYKNISDFSECELYAFEMRYMHISDKVEYLTAIQDDYYVKRYITSRNHIVKDTPKIYEDGTVGIDYFLCPILGIKYVKHNSESLKNYGITKERLVEWFPEFNFGSTESHAKNISEGLQKVDPITGKTIHQSTVEKAHVTRNTPDENGTTIYEKNAKKTRESHKNNIDQYGRNGYQQHADQYHADRIKTKTEGNYKLTDSQERYERIIELVTNRCRILYNHLGDWNVVWGAFCNKTNPPNAKQLDHKYSRHDGYINGISPLCVAHFNNVEILTLNENIRKGATSSLTIDELANINHMTINEMKHEFDMIMKVIDADIANGEIHNSMNVLIRAGEHIALKMKPYNELARACNQHEPDHSIDIATILNNL